MQGGSKSPKTWVSRGLSPQHNHSTLISAREANSRPPCSLSPVKRQKRTGDGAANAILTTDTRKKETAVCFEWEGKTVTIRAPFLTLSYTGVGIEGGCLSGEHGEV